METINSQSLQYAKPHMSSEFMARRRVYEGDDTKTFRAAVNILARGSSLRKKVTETKSDTPLPERLPTPTRIPSPTANKAMATPSSPASDKKRKNKLSEDIRPVVPKRTSSINLGQHKQRRTSRQDLLAFQRQSVMLFSSLNGTVIKSKASEGTLYSDYSQATGEKYSSDFSAGSLSGTSSTSSPAGSPVLYEESPLAFTLSRKRTSLPPVDNGVAFKPRAHEGKLSRRESQIAKRESVISIRDRASFLSSFPQPPKSPPPKTSSDHKRLTSTSRYILFPRTEPQRETEQGSKPSSPTHSNKFGFSRPTTAQGMRTPAGPSIDLARSTSVRSMSQPDLGLNTNLDLSLSYRSRRASRVAHSNAITSQPISWQPSENQARDNSVLDQTGHSIRSFARRMGTRKMFESLGGEKNRLSLCFNQSEDSLDDVDDEDGDDDNNDRSGMDAMQGGQSLANFGHLQSVAIPDVTALPNSNIAAVNSTAVEQNTEKTKLRRKGSGLFCLKPKSSSASDLLKENDEKETYEQRWEREIGRNKSIWKRMLCF